MKLGSIIFYKNIPSFFSWLQRFILGNPYSHNSIYIGVNELGRMEEFEANLEVGTTTFTNSAEHREVYPLDIPEDTIKKVLNELINEFEERSYGYVSWLTIFIRRCFEWLGFNAKKWKILWGWGVHCSELVYYYFLYLAWEMKWKDLENFLYLYNPNTFHPGDVKDIINKFFK